MKYFIIVAFCAFLVVEAVAHKHKQKCDTSDDCEADECCVGDEKKFFKKAECRKLEVEGNRCSEEDAHFRGRYLSRCPCVEGLTCQSKQVDTGRKDKKLKFNARCAGPSTTAEPELETEEPKLETEEPEPEPETEAPSAKSSEESAE